MVKPNDYRNQARLQRNLMYLAAIADSQPQPPSVLSQVNHKKYIYIYIVLKLKQTHWYCWFIYIAVWICWWWGYSGRRRVTLFAAAAAATGNSDVSAVSNGGSIFHAVCSAATALCISSASAVAP